MLRVFYGRLTWVTWRHMIAFLLSRLPFRYGGVENRPHHICTVQPVMAVSWFSTSFFLLASRGAKHELDFTDLRRLVTLG